MGEGRVRVNEKRTSLTSDLLPPQEARKLFSVGLAF
jgi:hypothetical protein